MSGENRNTSWLRTAIVLTVAAATIGAAPPRTPAPKQMEQNGRGKTVFVLPLHGPIDKALMIVFRRAFREVERIHPAAVIIDLDTPGGALRETEEIIQWMRSARSRNAIRIYAYVNPHALSAGAIVSLGCDAIFMAPGSRIGSAMPVMVSPFGGGVQEIPEGIEEKILSDVRSLVRGLAQENGYDPQVAEAMVDRSLELKIGDRVICKKGELLSLTAHEAVEIIPPRKKPLLARDIVDNREALLREVGLDGATIVEFKEEPAEKLARWITLFGPLLFALGALGIYIEFKTPGFGLPGILGISCLALFFFGHYIAGLAGIEDIVLVIIGFVLLGLEVFVIPGFGLPGLLGIILIMAGLALGFVPHIPKAPPLPGHGPGMALQPYIEDALKNTLYTLLIGAGGVWLLSRILPRTSAYGKLVLHTALEREQGYVASGIADQAAELLGKTGRTLTPLHPAGKAEIEGKRMDVISAGDLIPAGATVRIVKVEGARIVVEAVPAAETGSSA